MDISTQKILEFLKQKKNFDFSGYAESLIDMQAAQNLTSNTLSPAFYYFRFLLAAPQKTDNLIDNYISTMLFVCRECGIQEQQDKLKEQ